MDEREMQRQVDEAVAQALERLEEEPDSLVALFTAEAFGAMAQAPSEALKQARARFADERRRLGDEKLARALRGAGALTLLTNIWSGLGQSHYYGEEIGILADWILFLADDAGSLGQLPYAIGNWCGSWHEVDRPAADACERLAAAALALDPEEEASLWLYAQDDFLAAVNRGREKAARVFGPPVARKTPAQAVAKIERVLARYEAGDHPLDIPSLDTIPVDSPEVVSALIAGLECAEWRGRVRCVNALGRATVDVERAVEALCRVIDQPHLTDPVAMAVHYDLKGRAVAALETLIATSERLIAGLRESDSSDYRHQWPLRAVMSLAPECGGAERERAAEFLRRLLAQLPSFPAWKRERLFELQHEGPALMRRL